MPVSSNLPKSPELRRTPDTQNQKKTPQTSPEPPPFSGGSRPKQDVHLPVHSAPEESSNTFEPLRHTSFVSVRIGVAALVFRAGFDSTLERT